MRRRLVVCVALACAFTGKEALMQIKPRPTLYARSCLVIIGIILALAVSAKAGTITVTSTSDSGGSCP